VAYVHRHYIPRFLRQLTKEYNAYSSVMKVCSSVITDERVCIFCSDPLVLEFSPFMLDMLEVVNSAAESPKCVCTRNEQVTEAPAQNRANQTVRFGKSDGPISSVLTTVRGTVGSNEGILLLTNWHLTTGRDKIHNNSCGGG
jgi:hypothetical protein